MKARNCDSLLFVAVFLIVAVVGEHYHAPIVTLASPLVAVASIVVLRISRWLLARNSSDESSFNGRQVRIYGLAISVVVFLLDQATKGFAVHALSSAATGTDGHVFILPSLYVAADLWTNASFGFRDFAMTAAAEAFGICVVVFMLLTARNRIVALGEGLVVGGALANLADQFLRGGDLELFHIVSAGRVLLAFNVADVAVVGGFVFFLYGRLSSLFQRKASAP